MCVKYVRTHTNHTPELKHVLLSKSVREEVRQKYYGENRKIGFYSGRYVFLFKCESIIHFCIYLCRHPREPSGRGNREKFLCEATRATFMTRQDARNIVRTMDNALKHRHENDAVSVERLVCELEKEGNLVLAYKPQGVTKEAFPQLREESFLLVIMTAFQSEMFKKHSARIVCVDSTHNTNPYGFKLLTIVVPHEFKNGECFNTLHVFNIGSLQGTLM